LERLDGEIASLGGEVAAPKARKVRKRAAKKKARRARKATGRAVTKVRRKAAKKAKRAVGRAVRKPLGLYLVQALGKAGKTLRALELASAVLKAGYVTTDKNFKQTVASTLAADKRFERVSRGVYTLAGK